MAEMTLLARVTYGEDRVATVHLFRDPLNSEGVPVSQEMVTAGHTRSSAQIGSLAHRAAVAVLGYAEGTFDLSLEVERPSWVNVGDRVLLLGASLAEAIADDPTWPADQVGTVGMFPRVGGVLVDFPYGGVGVFPVEDLQPVDG